MMYLILVVDLKIILSLIYKIMNQIRLLDLDLTSISLFFFNFSYLRFSVSNHSLSRQLKKYIFIPIALG